MIGLILISLQDNTKELFRVRGCTNCHDIRRTLVGPSFEDIANRYEDNVKNRKVLTENIINGVCNKWHLRMDCCPKNRIDKEEAKLMIDWIFKQRRLER